MRLDRRLLHLMDAVGALEDVGGFRQPLFHIADGGVNLDGDVALDIGDADCVRFVVNDRRARLHCFQRIEDRRQHLVIDLDQLERLFGNLRRLGGDDGHAVAHMPHLAVERNLIPRMRVGPRLPTRRVDDARHIFVSEHGMNARQRARLRRVDAGDAGVGVRAGEHRRVQHAGQVDVIGKGGFALDQLDRVDFDLRLAHHIGGALRIDSREGEKGDFGLGEHVAAGARYLRLVGAADGVEEAFERNPARRLDGRDGLPAQHRRRTLHRLHRLDVARAAAEHAAQRVANLGVTRRQRLVEQLLRGQYHRRRAVATLDRARLGERLLDRVQRRAGAAVERLDRFNAAALDLRGQQHTRWGQLAVDQHRAGAAFAGLAAVFDAPHTVTAQHGHQRFARLTGKGAGDAVELELNVHALAPFAKAAVNARCASTSAICRR